MAELVRVKATTGEYVGKRLDTGVQEYLGIRYAKPPRRFKRAEPLEPSDKVYSALDNPPLPWQVVWPEEMEAPAFMSEDCLTLNVWTADTTAPKPVYVFIHGGSYAEGSIRTDFYEGIYCGDGFVRDHPDTVFVNIEYRMGLFGSLDLSTLEGGEAYLDSNNLQLLDMIEALRWIKANIAAFGGDPARVTVGGQSAGSNAIFHLLAMPEAAGLFQQAICESSAPTTSPIRHSKTPEKAKAGARKVFELLGVSTLEELLDLAPDALNAAGDEYFYMPEFNGFEPCLDDKLVPSRIEEALASGISKGVRVMAGSVAGEYSTMMLRMSADEVEEMIHRRAPQVTAEDIVAFKANDPARDKKTTMEDLYNDLMLRLRQTTATEAVAAGGSPTFVYYIDFTPEGAKVRSQHCSELCYVSGKPDARAYLDATTGEAYAGEKPDYAFGKLVQGVWHRFITTGNPGGGEVGQWPEYTLDGQETMVLDRTCHVENCVRKADFDIVRKYA